MKKMVPLIIFLVILSAAVFAGCANFTQVLSPGDSTTEEAGTNGTGEPVYEGETEMVPLDVPVLDAQGNPVTEADGNWVTTREYYPVEIETAAPSTAPSGNEQPGNVPETTKKTSGDNGQKPSGGTDKNPDGGNTGTPAASSEYDILRSGNFYMRGTMFDGADTLPLEVAITPNTIYMTSEMDGISVAILVDANQKVYMMMNQKKVYLELSDAVMKYMNISAEELVSSDSVDFSKYPPLAEAKKVSDVKINGTACKEYIFSAEEGDTRVYMNGSKLIRFASYAPSGALLTQSDVSSITGSVPADKIAPPKDYKGYSGVTGVIGFMKQIADLMME